MSRPVLAAAFLLGCAPAPAQPPAPAPADGAALRGDSPPTRKRLAEAEAKLVAGKARDAADDLQRLLDEAGDDFVSLDGRHFRPARWVAHALLARLPADALKAYQARIDEPARRLLDAGKRDRDPRPLWQLADRYFVSKPAADGLLVLGDLLFERGEYRTAEGVWRRLLADAGADVVHPAPAADPVAVRARILLAVIFAGEPDRAAVELRAFAEEHPGAAGHLAGKTGPYADTLRDYLDRPPRPSGDPTGGADWPTFAGDPGRTGRARGPIPHHWPSAPTWVAQIPVGAADRPDVPAAPGRPPFGHPVIADGKVYLADTGRVLAFDLRTGSPAAQPGRPRPAPGFSARGIPDPDPCATLGWADGRLFARTGPAAVRPPEASRPGRPADDSALVSLAPPAEPGGRLREGWRLPPPQPAEGKKTAAWEGAPLVAGGRLWAALARFEDGRVVHAVAGLDPADPDPAPDRPTWVADLCDAPAGTERRARQELLTLAGRDVVFCSHTGAVVAVDALTGRRAWAYLYPRSVRRPEPARPDQPRVDLPRPADPSPAVAWGGRVFVAPADADRVFALDAETGKLLWESERAEGAAILGVARGRVIVSTTGPVRGLRALSVVNGSYRRSDGWVQAGTTSDWLGYGRGFVSDRAVVWPSRSRYGLYFLDPETGEPIPTAPPIPGPRNGLWGNVAYADGVLVCVTPTEVWGFVAEGKPPPDPPPADPRRRFIAAVDRAERELADGNPAVARATLRGVIRGDLPAGWRAWAAARLLALESPADVADVLTPDLLPEWLVTAAGEIVTLRTLADRHAGRPDPPPTPDPPGLVAARPPDVVSELPPRACVRHEQRLPPASQPLRPIPGGSAPPRHVFVATPDRVLGVVLDTRDRSVTEFPAADRFTHAADLPRGFVAAGPFAVAVFDTPGEPPWVFRVPDTDPLPDRPRRPLSTHAAPAPHLSSFALAGAWLVARLGDRHLLALDLPGRRVAWVLGGDGRAGYRPVGFGPTPRFGPELLTSDRLVVVQLSDGRRWAVDRVTGRPRSPGDPTARVTWSAPPAALGGWVLVSDGPGLVRRVNPVTGRTKWAYEAGGGTSLAGDPPAVLAWGDTIVAAVRRDYGVDLDRLDPKSGASLWAGGPAFVDAGRVDLRHADADPHHLYVPAANRLLAFHLGNGKPAWSVDLPESNTPAGWRVQVSRWAVVVTPAEAVPPGPVAGVFDRATRSWLRLPAGWRLPGLAAAVYDTLVDRSAPVLLIDAETGEVLKELAVPARGPGVVARLTPDALVLATGDRVVWVR